jgi:hypothetical protein
MKLGDKEVAMLKKRLSPEDVLTIVSLKAKMNERARKAKAMQHMNESSDINERQAIGFEEPAWVKGFKKFCAEYLDEQERNQIENIFSKLSSDVVNQRFLQTVYTCFSDMIDKVDKEMIDSAN